MEDIKKLTRVQQDLINGLVKEFTKINPKPNNGVARFGFDTINDCMKEEERFLQTIAKHNQTMMKVFVDQLKSDVESFEKEFGKVIGIEYGHTYPQTNNECNSLNTFLAKNTKNILSRNEGSEIRLYFVSKVKRYCSDSRYDYFNGKQYHNVYVDFKREKVITRLESGKEVYAYKIVGLTYNTYDWLGRDKEYNRSFTTLDEMVQSHKPLQQRIVELVQ